MKITGLNAHVILGHCDACEKLQKKHPNRMCLDCESTRSWAMKGIYTREDESILKRKRSGVVRNCRRCSAKLKPRYAYFCGACHTALNTEDDCHGFDVLHSQDGPME